MSIFSKFYLFQNKTEINIKQGKLTKVQKIIYVS